MWENATLPNIPSVPFRRKIGGSGIFLPSPFSGVVRIGPRSGGVCGDVLVFAIRSVNSLFVACLASGVVLLGPTGPREW